jgi:hypothetical protein
MMLKYLTDLELGRFAFVGIGAVRRTEDIDKVL